MSSHLSPAQSLPVDVLRLILQWVTLEKRSLLNGDSYYLDPLKELLTVCSSWRQEALEFLWRHLNFGIDSKTNEVRLRCPGWVDNNALPHNVTSLARELYFLVSLSGIISGNAYKQLVDFIGDTRCFPLANKLTVDIKEYKSQHIDSKDIAIAHALDFAKHVKSMAPAATTVNVICDGEGFFTSREIIENNLGRYLDEEIVEKFASVLHPDTKHAYLKLSRVGINHLSTLNSIPPLSKLEIYCEEFSDAYTSLMHKSAYTLQSLGITLGDANKLIYDKDGVAVIYPNLQYLQLSPSNRYGPNAMAKCSTAIPFPVLRNLKLNDSYPFTDDVLFRGNTRTLKSLGLCLDYNAITTLSKCQVFESKHKVLRSVTINWYDSYWNTPVNSEVSVDEFLNHLVDSAERLSAMSLGMGKVCLSAIEHGQGFKSIKILHLCDSLSVFDVFSMLKAIPALVEFRCGIKSLGPELDNISDSELPDYIASTYCGVGKNFQIWDMISLNHQFIPTLIGFMLGLVLLCPQLRKIDVWYGSLKAFQAKIADALNNQLLSKHAPRLNRLLDIVCE